MSARAAIAVAAGPLLLACLASFRAGPQPGPEAVAVDALRICRDEALEDCGEPVRYRIRRRIELESLP